MQGVIEMEVVGYQNPLCMMGIEYDDETVEIEKRIEAICGELDPEEVADLRAQRMEIVRDRKKKATDSAQELLRKYNRPVKRKDLIGAMDVAIMDGVRYFEKKPDIRNALRLLATVICKNILMDGPLYEEK